MATTASTSGVRTPSAPSDSDPAWREDLAAYLRPQMFPAGQDELQATLLRLHAPSRLLWRLAALSPMRQYASLDTVIEEVDRRSGTHVVREPL